ncbi:hypothetical protein D3C87_2072390 [compost metagenome]
MRVVELVRTMTGLPVMSWMPSITSARLAARVGSPLPDRVTMSASCQLLARRSSSTRSVET